MTLTTLSMVTVLNLAMFGTAPRDAAREAYFRSAETGRPLVFLFGATWCPACRVMKDTTLPQVERAGNLRGVEFAYIDIDDRPAFAKRYLRGNSVPQLVRFDRDGDRWKARYLIGAQNPDRVARFLATESSGTPASYSSYHPQESAR